jgi:DNA/RNA-binding domain of Phe-tRNA-synthetase-like protein
MITLSEQWITRYPDAHIGILEMQNVSNPADCPLLDVKKKDIESLLRAKFTDGGKPAIRSLPVMQAYKAYYRNFKKSYHVQQQVESIVLKGWSIPSVAPLVESMFMAELKHGLLTAGHDFDVLQPPIVVKVASGSEVYIRLNGQEQMLKTGDMYIADSVGVMSAIIYGPDQRTQITSDTRNVIYTVYAPSGISVSQVEDHLQELRDNVMLVTPDAQVTELHIYGAK